jgi:small subunit ribosomal protein S1
VEIADGVEGLCHVSEAVDATGKPIELEVGQEHEFKIVKMNQEEKKVGLSIRAVGEEASRAEVELYKEASTRDHSGSNKGQKGGGKSGQSSSSSSSSTTLGDLLNWKRAEREGEDSND